MRDYPPDLKLLREYGAVFSPCGFYRYALWRTICHFRPLSFIAFIGLNPSTADETHDDPTIRRCRSFSEALGASAFCMLNLFAWRATDPKDMFVAAEPIGLHNDAWIQEVSQRALRTVACWGNHGAYRGRDQEVITLLPQLQCFGRTKQGAPRHPLYLSKKTMLVPYSTLESTDAAD